MQNLDPVNPNAVLDELVFDLRYKFGPSSITEVDKQLFLVWTEPDRSPKIFLSVFDEGRWSPPETLFEASTNDVQVYDPSIQHINESLFLFFAVGRLAEGRPKDAKGYFMTSCDLGATWAPPKLLSFNSPSAGKGILKPDGQVMFVCQNGPSVEFVYRSNVGEWSRGDRLTSSEYTLGMPVLVQHKNGTIQLFTRSSYKRILTSFLRDNGSEWSDVGLTEIPVPNSTIDAISLDDGRILVAYNHSESVRTPLCLALSMDGYAWKLGILIDNKKDQLTFPCLHQDESGHVHLIYTRRKTREVVHWIVAPEKL